VLTVFPLHQPSQGLGPRIVEQIFETIDGIRRELRLTILLVEQRVVLRPRDRPRGARRPACGAPG
jgi:ABC-type branched-subunit amino acid transport system ATPase component